MTPYSIHNGKHVKSNSSHNHLVFLIVCCALFVGILFLGISTCKETEEPEEKPQQNTVPVENISPVNCRSLSAQIPQEWVETELGYSYPYEITKQVSVDPVDAEYLANVTWGEARGCSVIEQAAVMWCVLNRVDSSLYPDSVAEVVTQYSQFHGYSKSNPITPELLELANKVLTYWLSGDESGRILPEGYLFFTGDGKHNYFYVDWMHSLEPWDWSLPNPYEEVTVE